MTDTKADTSSQEPVNETKSTDKTSEKKVSSKARWPWFILAFIVGTATSLFIFNNPQLLKEFVGLATNQQALTASISPQPSSINHTASTPTKPTPTVELAPPNTMAAVTTPTTPNYAPISSQEAADLIQGMQVLQEHILALQIELNILKEHQEKVKQTQSHIEDMQLHTRLAWIADLSNHLPQIQLAWQEITLLPSLTLEQRQQAENMLSLAQQKAQQVSQWQQEMDHIIASLQLSHYDNIIPKALPESPDVWLQWLANQFSLKHAQSSEELALKQLKNTLTQIKQNMNLEQWPDAQAWTKLRAQLQLRMLKSSQAAKPIQLPEDFTAIQEQLTQLREQAKQWLKEQ